MPVVNKLYPNVFHLSHCQWPCDIKDQAADQAPGRRGWLGLSPGPSPRLLFTACH